MGHSFRARHPLLVSCAVALGCALACQFVVGDFELTDPVPATLCRAGEFRCNGGVLFLCNATADGWLTRDNCNGDEEKPYCDSALKRCVPCTPGQYRCDGNELETCDPKDRSWSLVESCANANQCNSRSNSCRPCQEGEIACSGKLLLQCSADGAWNPLGPCETAALCQLTANRQQTQCAKPMPECPEPGRHFCQNGRLLRCSLGRDRAEFVQMCATPELCDPAAADAMASQGKFSQCLSECEPNQYSCNGNELRRCNDQLKGWDTIEICSDPASPCNAKAKKCAPCIPGESQCNGASLEECDPSTKWTKVKECKSARLCNQDERLCKPPACQIPGMVFGPNGSDQPPEVLREGLMDNYFFECSDDYTWLKFGPCKTAKLYNARDRRCEQPACDGGVIRCVRDPDNGDRAEVCNEDLTGWRELGRCPIGTYCDPEQAGACLEGPCIADQYRCNDVYLERCDATGRWIRQDKCAASTLCMTTADSTAGRCEQPICGGTLGEYQCNPPGKEPGLYECDRRREWRQSSGCSVCDPGYADLIPGSCTECVFGTYSCEGNKLSRCGLDADSTYAFHQIKDCPKVCSADGNCN